jgi:hypothetical protein
MEIIVMSMDMLWNLQMLKTDRKMGFVDKS